MKKIYLLICTFLLVASHVMGQNVLFIPFGQDVGELRQTLKGKDYIKRVVRDGQTLETQINYMRKMRYHMFYDHLYSIEDERVYLNKKEAERIIQTCIKFLESNDRKAHVISRKNGVTHYVAIHTDRIIEFTVKKTRIKRKKYEFVLNLKSTSRFHGPKNETEAFARSIIEKFD
ncbi:MAG: hypothetical protein MRZ79_09475 [Bacteroidia bacterium]|nr:hypothetical protein [Bacteroidia bacterium]